MSLTYRGQILECLRGLRVLQIASASAAAAPATPKVSLASTCSSRVAIEHVSRRVAYSTWSSSLQPKNAKSTSNVPRSAPVPLAERCDAGPWWVGGDESRARSGAERRCARPSARASQREILANRRQMRRGPRPAFSLIAASVERWMGAARSAAEGADAEPFSALFRGPKNAKSTSTAPRSAPVALADRRDDVWGRTGG
ncbi:hypothetical protein EV121DRAFT_297639 [Schizophyllum commune]